MGTGTPLSGLGLSTLVSIPPDAEVVPKILYTTVNWAYTNRQGMTFGILFGALLMVLASLLERRTFRGSVSNTVAGMLIGTPMGVCVNCATPVAKAIRAAGGRSETMLAAMISSPTLNVVVLTMLFSLFPLYMAMIKISLTLAFILVGIPLVVHLFAAPNANSAGECDVPVHVSLLTRDESWPRAALWVAKSFFEHLWFLIKTTGPLMLLAGVLGSALVVLVPLESLTNLLPRAGRLRVLMGTGFASLIGGFLPVPMSFDVIVTAILSRAGLPVA